MENPFEDENELDTADTVFRDMTMLALSGFVIIVLLLLPWLNIVAQDEATKEPAGSVIVEVLWPDDRDVDVDLWVKSPDDAAVGFSNMAGYYFNLLRDDLGVYKDPTPINYEVAYSRGINPGEHIVNLHLYREDISAFDPFEAKVVVTVVNPKTKVRQQLLESSVLLDEIGKELTIFRFELDEDGNLNKESLNNKFVQLRSGSK